MGIALAEEADALGADVDLVLGPVSLFPSTGKIKVINVVTAESMAKECMSRFPSCNIAILSAAVADYSPVNIEKEKIKKTANDLVLRLKPTPDIAMELGRMKKSSQIVAGFALETGDGLAKAKDKLKRKKLDLIVLNSLEDKGAGFGYDTNRITIIDKYNNIDKFELKTKEEAARDILEKIVSMIK